MCCTMLMLPHYAASLFSFHLDADERMNILKTLRISHQHFRKQKTLTANKIKVREMMRERKMMKFILSVVCLVKMKYSRGLKKKFFDMQKRHFTEFPEIRKIYQISLLPCDISHKERSKSWRRWRVDVHHRKLARRWLFGGLINASFSSYSLWNLS